MQSSLQPSALAVRRDDLTLSQRLVTAMRQAILDGRLEPGRHLKERELCELFDVSRGLVREAVQVLVGEELITAVPHRGLVVTMLDRKAAAELYGLRGALEGFAFAEFTRKAGPAERDAFFSATEELLSLSPKDGADRLITVKNAFYRCLLSGCDNRPLTQMFTQLNNRIVQLRRLTLSRPERLPNTLREIEAIANAVRAGSADEARRLAERHVAAAANVADAQFCVFERETQL